MTEVLSLDRYMVRRKVMKLFGGAFHVYDDEEQIVAFSEMKAFKLKEDIRVFDGEDKKTELLTIKARKILDFSSAYDVVDARTGERVGALKRKGLKSILRDQWIVMDADDRDIASIDEDSMLLALIRRLITPIIPQTYIVTMQDRRVAEMKQNWNPFVYKLNVQYDSVTDTTLDRRLGLAAALLLAAIEGKQN